MASLKELKGRIVSVKSTQKITKAKKMVAAAKLRKAQAAAEAARPYAERLEGVVASLASKVGASDSAPKLLSGTGKSDTHLLVVLNSDRGLAGAFNSNIVKAMIPVPPPADVPTSSGAAVEYEPDEEAILADLLPRNVTIQIFKGLLENAASEQGASMTAMDNATRNAGELINKLTIVYNRTRQAAITTELIEIIAGAEAL